MIARLFLRLGPVATFRYVPRAAVLSFAWRVSATYLLLASAAAGVVAAVLHSSLS